MLKQATEIQSIQRQFQDITTLLNSIVSKLSLAGNPMVSTAIQDITRVSQSIHKVESGVSEQLTLRRSQTDSVGGDWKRDQFITGQGTGARRGDGLVDRLAACRARLPDAASS